MPENKETPREYNQAIIKVHPLLTAEQLHHKLKGLQEEKCKSVLLLAYASGTVPDWIVPVILWYSMHGMAFFTLSDNPKEDHGIIKLHYRTNITSLQAGSVPLQKVNSSNQLEVIEVIQDCIDKGLFGANLQEAVYDYYAYTQNDPLPTSEMMKSDEVEQNIQAMHNKVKNILELMKENPASLSLLAEDDNGKEAARKNMSPGG